MIHISPADRLVLLTPFTAHVEPINQTLDHWILEQLGFVQFVHSIFTGTHMFLRFFGALHDPIYK